MTVVGVTFCSCNLEHGGVNEVKYTKKIDKVTLSQWPR